MALPNIMRRLFRNDGYGPILKPEIIPFTADPTSAAPDVAASTEWVKNLVTVTVYLDSVNGNDDNDGSSWSNAVKTYDEALSRIVYGSVVRINVAAGTYERFYAGTDLPYGLHLYIYGNVTLTGNVFVNANSLKILNGDGGNYTVTITGAVKDSSFGNAGIYVLRNGYFYSNISFNITSNDAYCILVGDLSSVYFSDDTNTSCTHTSNNNARASIRCYHGSLCRLNSCTMSGNAAVNPVYVSESSITTINNLFSNSGMTASIPLKAIRCSSILLDGVVKIHSDSDSAIVADSNSVISATISTGTDNFITAGTSDTIFANHNSYIVLNVDSGRKVNIGNNNNGNSDGLFAYADSEITLSGSGTVSFSGSYSVVANANTNSSIIIASSLALSGSPSGKRYNASRGAQINVGGTGQNRIPGNVAGTVTANTGSYYA